MITVLSSTNRLGAHTRVISDIYIEILEQLGQEIQLLDLRELPEDFIFSATFDKAGTHPQFNEIQSAILASNKYVFIVPEYNGSFPGILKAFIDSLSYPSSFGGKAAAIVGISSGSMGGALAVSHLTDILNYLGMFVLPVKPRLSSIHKFIDDEGHLTNDLYRQLLSIQAKQLADFTCMND
jgi:NAD(P)H-dependent FMN reductase